MAVDLEMPVLIVDDYKTMLRIIRNLLKQIGSMTVFLNDVEGRISFPSAYALDDIWVSQPLHEIQ